MSRRSGNPWLRLDVQTYADAKVRIGRCGAVWPWCLATIKRCGGTASDEDLDHMLAAADLCIPLDLAREQIEGAKRVGLLVQQDGEWTTPRWDEYQPDPRVRGSARRKAKGIQSDPGRPRDNPTRPRDKGGCPDPSHFDPCYGTGRDGTLRDKDPDPPDVGGSRARATPPATALTSPHRERGQEGSAKGQLPVDVNNRWAALMDAGGAPMRPALVEHLMQAWRDFDADVIRLALAELEDGKETNYGRAPKPSWLLDRCKRIHAERMAGASGTSAPGASSAGRRTYPGGEGKHTAPVEGDLPPFDLADVPEWGIRAVDAIGAVTVGGLNDAERHEVADVLRREHDWTVRAIHRVADTGSWRSFRAALTNILPTARRIAEAEAEEAEGWGEFYKGDMTPQQRESHARRAAMRPFDEVKGRFDAISTNPQRPTGDIEGEA